MELQDHTSIADEVDHDTYSDLCCQQIAGKYLLFWHFL